MLKKDSSPKAQKHNSDSVNPIGNIIINMALLIENVFCVVACPRCGTVGLNFSMQQACQEI